MQKFGAIKISSFIVVRNLNIEYCNGKYDLSVYSFTLRFQNLKSLNSRLFQYFCGHYSKRKHAFRALMLIAQICSVFNFLVILVEMVEFLPTH